MNNSPVKVFWTSFEESLWTKDKVDFYNHLLPNKEVIDWNSAKPGVKMSFAAKSFLHEILSDDYQIKLKNSSFDRDNNGKPYFPDLPLYFNISHSKSIIGVAICEVGPVGFDIQEHRKYSDGITNRLFCEEERHMYTDANSKHDFFFDTWSKKEALVKATGIGIKTGLTSFSALKDSLELNEHHLHVSNLNIKEGYSSAIATSHVPENIIISSK